MVYEALFISGPPNTIAHFFGLHCCIYALQAMNTSVTFIHPTYAITTCLQANWVLTKSSISLSL